MKKLLLITIIPLFISCTKTTSHIEVAEGYVENLAKHNLKEFTKYCTESTAIKATVRVNNRAIKLIPDYEFRFISDSLADDRAWVTFDNAGKEGTSDTVPLVMIDGEWKVHFD